VIPVTAFLRSAITASFLFWATPAGENQRLQPKIGRIVRRLCSKPFVNGYRTRNWSSSMGRFIVDVDLRDPDRGAAGTARCSTRR
jgi:hypothetical protein